MPNHRSKSMISAGCRYPQAAGRNCPYTTEVLERPSPWQLDANPTCLVVASAGEPVRRKSRNVHVTNRGDSSLPVIFYCAPTDVLHGRSACSQHRRPIFGTPVLTTYGTMELMPLSTGHQGGLSVSPDSGQARCTDSLESGVGPSALFRAESGGVPAQASS